MSTELKAKRSAALEEKRRRLEELKARRNQRSSDSNSFSAVTASKNGNLDEYIDDLLNSAPPIAPVTSGLPETSENAPIISTSVQSKVKNVSKIDQLNEKSVSTAPTSGAPEVVVPPAKKVEVFNSSTQTEEEDFPMPPTDENELNITTTKSSEVNLSLDNEEMEETSGMPVIEPSLLTEEEIKLTLSSKPFYNFINSASKKVERLLGAPLLADLLVDDAAYYADKESKKDATTSTREKEHSLIAAQVSFSFPKWTSDRDVTSLDWSPHHRGEMMLASYHMPYSSKSSMRTTAISGLASNTTSSASLFPRSKSEMIESDGLAILWNLTMPSRPEHIFTCGSPVLSAKFHPMEGPLVVGGCYSGQIVVWDVRNGRLPVQRSTLNILGGNAGIGGHVHSIVGLEALDSGFVSASSDGTINFWSFANLIEPAETLVIPNAHISSISVVPSSQTILVGDENGSIYGVVSQSSSGGRSVKRSIVNLDNSKSNQSDSSRHYGNVTGLATKPTMKGDNTIGISKGFPRGINGLFMSCGVDWTTKLWAPAYSDKPLLNFLSHSYDYMSDVQWNPNHPTVFATASSNGTLGLWNLATSLDEPITGLQGLLLEKSDENPHQPSHGVNKIKWSRDGKRIAAACSDTVHVLGITEELWKPKGNEGTKVMNLLKSRGLIDEV